MRVDFFRKKAQKIDKTCSVSNPELFYSQKNSTEKRVHCQADYKMLKIAKKSSEER